jgi:hypothetical protein
MQKSTTAEMAEVSAAAPKGRRMALRHAANARPRFIKVLIATIARFQSLGMWPTGAGGLDVLAITI